jgi:RNA polymerase sigma factor (TIGR02999 family)
MPAPPAPPVTQLLLAWRSGDQEAFDRLMPLVYDELRRLARLQLRRERPDHTLQPAALVNEAYLRLVDIRQINWRDRSHFFAMAARQMRRILVDHARARRYQKRGGGAAKVTFDEAVFAKDRAKDLVALDDALDSLAKLDARKAHVVELRFFGGLTNVETAALLNVSTDTVMRDWKTAKTWLLRELRKDASIDR